MKSGTQNWKLILYPAYLKGVQTETLSRGIEANIELETLKFREDGVDNIAPTFSLIETPKKKDEHGDMVYAEAGKKMMVYEGTFQATVPYELTGWSQSVDLRKEDSAKLLQEVVAACKEYLDIIEGKDGKELAEKVYKKEKEYAQALFLDQKETKEQWDTYISNFKEPTLKIQPLEHFQMKIYGNGRLVTLQRTDYPNIGESALRADYKNKKGEDYEETYIYFLHRPHLGGTLELIR